MDEKLEILAEGENKRQAEDAETMNGHVEPKRSAFCWHSSGCEEDEVCKCE